MRQQPGYKLLINSAPQELVVQANRSEYIDGEFTKGFDLKRSYRNDSFILSRNICLNEEETYIYVIYQFGEGKDKHLQMRVLPNKHYKYNVRSHISLAHKGKLDRSHCLGNHQFDVNVILAGQISSKSGNQLVVNNESSDYVSTEERFDMCKEFIKETLGTKYNIRFNYIEVRRLNY